MKPDRIPVVREGVPFVLGAAFVTVVWALLGWTVLSLIGVGLTFFCLYFFRDPERTFTSSEAGIVSPADGRVLSVRRGVEQRYYKGECVRIGIFMSLWDVHVNRFPVEGTVAEVEYTEGTFVAANRKQASLRNEQCAVAIETPDGRKVVVVQIAGLIARRIVCWAEPGDRITKGMRMGMIRFGSRVDLYLPPDADVWVRSGSRVRAGETLVGRFA